jgi:putative ABC transport system permease protein
VSLRQEPADAGYVPTYQIPIIQGKNFNDNLAASEKNAVLINRAAMDAFGWKNAVGKQIKAKGENGTAYTVIGVMENFHYQDLQNNIEPLVQWYGGKANLRNRYLSVRTDPGYIKPVMNKLEQEFKTMPSRRDFSYELMSSRVDEQYALLDGILKVTNYIALLTILIAAMGMFGLISLFAKQRVKEIGIRKVLGASVSGIVKLLSTDFLLLVGIAVIIATPLAWYIMNNWLQDFAYRINISWWMFCMSGVIAILIALITVSFQSIKAAIANPVESLRSE